MATYNIKDTGGEAKAGYYKKMKDVDLDCCPYQIPSIAWKNDPTIWPGLEIPDIYVCLIETPSAFTRVSLKNRKSLEAHNRFISGWVRTVYLYQKLGSNLLILKAKVMPSQRLNETIHLSWVAINLKGTSVQVAHCICIAGLGELCSHIGALLLKVEAAVRTGFMKKACTDVACTWNQDFVKKVKPDKISKYTPEKQPKNENIGSFLSKLSKLECKPVILHSYSERCDTFIPKFKPPERARLPNMMRSYYSSMHKEQINVKCNEIFLKLKLQDIDYVKSLTRKQSNCLIWHDVR